MSRISLSRISLATLVSLLLVGPTVAQTSLATPTPDPTKEPVLYVVTYSHLDTEWCWTYRHSIQEYIPNTLRENFALFEQYPHYVFNWTGANRYRFARDYYPEEYARLKQYVAAGRWIPTGCGWDENDTLVPSPESLIRGILYSNRWFQKEFGKTSSQYMLPDSFGFPASLPTILAHCGLNGFSTKKLTYGAGSPVGIPFNVGWWVGPDGRSIIAALNPGDYRTRVKDDLSQNPVWLERLQNNGQRTGVFADYMYHGNGDVGGSPGAESAANLERSLAGTGPIKIRAGSADDFFRDLTSDALKGRTTGLPQYRGDLLLIQHSAGSINSGAAMKRWNHRNERLADAAERAAVSARRLSGAAYPQERLTDTWERFLGGQMHDILPGTSLPAAYEFAWNDQVIALNQFADVATTAVSQVAERMDTRSRGIPLVVYNPLAVERDEVVSATVTFPGAAPEQVRVLGPDGKEVPAQVASRKGSRATVQFLARVPSVGFAVFDVQAGTASSTVRTTLRATASELENARYRIRLDANGDIASIFDKQANREVLSAPMRLAFLYEKPQRNPAWNMDWTDRQKPPVGYVDGPARISVLENGPARVALVVEREARGSRFRQVVRLAAGQAGDRVEFLTDVNWRTTESSLKAVFPLTVSAPEATYSEGVCVVRRGNNDPKKYEVPAHEWFDLTATDGKYGVSILNEAKYGSDKPDDQTLRLTLLYTPGVRDRFQHQGTQDWGHHEIQYALFGHPGNAQSPSAHQAARLNQPMQVYQTTAHAGQQRRFSLLSVDAPSVTVAALKKCEDSDEIVVRLFEQDGKPVRNAHLSMATPILRVRQVDGQEHTVNGDGAAVVRDGKLVFDMEPYRPRAFALTLSPSPTAPAIVETPLSLPFNRNVSRARDGKGGGMDSEGRAYPDEQIPARVVSGATTFSLGSGGTGAKKALACEGQQVTLPGKGRRWLYFVAAANGGDLPATLRFVGANSTAAVTVHNWDGYVGQWDNRLWKGEVPERTANWTNELDRIAPGFIKRQPIAWYSDHRRLADGVNDAYRFCYLFRYGVPIPEGATAVVLPNDARIFLFSAVVSTRPADTVPAAPLYDELRNAPLKDK